MNDARGNIVSERAERIVQLLGLDGAGAIPIESAEGVLPLLDVIPQPLELVHANSTRAVLS